MDDVSPGTLVAATVTGPTGAGALLTPDGGPVAAKLLSRLDVEHPVLAGLPARERLLAAAWLAGSSTSRRLSALTSFYRHLVEHDLIT